MAVETMTAGEKPGPAPAGKYELLLTAVHDVAEAVLNGAPRIDILQMVVMWAARLMPDAHVAAIEVHGRRASVAAAANTPASWIGSGFELQAASPIAQAIEHPERLVRALPGDAREGFLDEADESLRQSVIECVAVSSPSGKMVVLAAWVDPAAMELPGCKSALLTAVKLLGAADMAAANTAASGYVNKAIARAKQEWECTVDSLPQLVFLVDDDCRILRANRTVEAWSLGKVDALRGRPVHDVLHPGCGGEPCLLAGSLAEARKQLQQRGNSCTTIHDERLGRVLDVTMRKIPVGSNGSHQPSELALIVLSDITMLHAIQADLQTANEQLELRIEERTREANASREELSVLSGQLMTAQEDERKRIAQELHDCIGQSLSAVKYSLERAEEMTHQSDASAPRHLLLTTIARVQETIDAIRTIAMDLRPSLLDDFGPVAAVRWLCREFGDVYAHIRVHTDFSVSDAEIPERLRTPIFRTVQESFNNIAKHAQARNVFVSLRGDPAGLGLEIRDDGIGFDLKEAGRPPQQGHGLSGLRERAGKTGGTFSVRSKRHAGTVVRVGWPLDRVKTSLGTATRKGFTLLELLVVMVIIGILAGFVAPRYFAQVGKSQTKAAMAQVDAFDKALDQYRLDMGRYPTTEEGLEALMKAPIDDPAWTGPYLKKAVPKDPWGRPYVYLSPGTHGENDVVSYGKDGQPGGTGENADIGNW